MDRIVQMQKELLLHLGDKFGLFQCDWIVLDQKAITLFAFTR